MHFTDDHCSLQLQYRRRARTIWHRRSSEIGSYVRTPSGEVSLAWHAEPEMYYEDHDISRDCDGCQINPFEMFPDRPSWTVSPRYNEALPSYVLLKRVHRSDGR